MHCNTCCNSVLNVTAVNHRNLCQSSDDDNNNDILCNEKTVSMIMFNEHFQV